MESSSGNITYKDYDKNEVYNYNPDSKRIVLSTLSDETMPKPFGADSPWSLMESSIQRMIRFGGDVTRKTGQYNGQNVEIVEIAATPRPNVAAVRAKIFVDKATSLPIAEERVYINTNIDKPQCLDNETFEYPKRGPADIYDLGLSRDIPIINSLGLPPWQDIFNAYISYKYKLQIPEKYIAIVTRKVGPRGSLTEFVEVCYAGGGCFKKERYSPDDLGADIGNTFDSLLEWTQSLKNKGSISISLYLENCFYSAERTEHGYWTTTKQTRKGRELNAVDFWQLSHLADIGWPDILGHADVIQDDFARENNLIRIESKGRQWYLNPDRDYICQKHGYPDGATTEVKEFAQTREGKWYPKNVQGPWISHTIYLETNPVFPEGIFDPNELPKDGWQRKTGD